VTLGSIVCVNLRIGGADYPFYFTNSGERIRLDAMPKDVTIVIDKNTAISSGFDGCGFYMDRPVVYER